MAHVVTSKCVGCKFTDCVEVCPVACFYELDGQLIIHPDECIDCTACVAECPVEAIYADTDVPAEFEADTEMNATESARLSSEGVAAITAKKDPLPTAEARKKRARLLVSDPSGCSCVPSRAPTSEKDIRSTRSASAGRVARDPVPSAQTVQTAPV